MTFEATQVRRAPVVAIGEPGRPLLFVLVPHSLEIGRDCSGVLLSDPSISRRHLLVLPADDLVRVSDLGTTNGSTLDGVPLEANRTLQVGETVTFGHSTLTLVIP